MKHSIFLIPLAMAFASCEKEAATPPKAVAVPEVAPSDAELPPPAVIVLEEPIIEEPIIEEEVVVIDPVTGEVRTAPTPGQRLDHALQKTGQGIQTAGQKTQEAAIIAEERTEQGLRTAREKTEMGLRKAADATGNFLKRAGEKIEDAAVPPPDEP